MEFNMLSRVGVAGTGLMGTAIGKAFLRAGLDLHVWNRNLDLTAGLVEAGAKCSQTFEGLMASVDIVVIQVSTYEVVKSLIADVDLKEKIIVAGCTGTIEDSEIVSAMIKEAGGHFLNIEVMTYPDEVSQGASMAVTSGERWLHDTVLPVLSSIGEIRFAGNKPGASKALGLAYGAFMQVALIGGLQAAALFESCGGDPAVLMAVINQSQKNLEGVLSRIPSVAERAFPAPSAEHASIQVHLTILDDELLTADKTGIDLSLLRASKPVLEQFAAAGYLDKDIEHCYRLLAPAKNIASMN